MSTNEKKQRQFERREQELLAIASKLYREQGEQAVSMDNLVLHSDYSKGTIYKHFSSKEDLVACMALHHLQRFCALCETVTRLDCGSREKMVAIHLMPYFIIQQHGDICSLMTSCKTGMVKERMSEPRQQQLHQEEERMLEPILEVIQEGVTRGDLALDGNSTPRSLAFISHAITYGFINLMQFGAGDQFMTDEKLAEQIFLEATSKLLDGYHWQPLSNDYDYRLTMQLTRDIFKTIRDC